MADLLPAHLQCATGVIYAGTVTDAPVLFTRVPIEIHNVDVIAVDSASTFTGGTVTLEWEVEAAGSDTTIDAITVATNDWDTATAHADFTSTIVPAGSRIMATVADITGVVTNVLVIQIWYVPLLAG